MPRKRLNSTDPSIPDQVRESMEADSKVKSQDGRRELAGSARTSRPRVTKVRKSAVKKTEAPEPSPVPVEEHQLGQSLPTQTYSVPSPEMKEPLLPPVREKTAHGGVSIEERIALLAYSYWEARGCRGGSAEEDWFRAEKEILRQIRPTAHT